MPPAKTTLQSRRGFLALVPLAAAARQAETQSPLTPLFDGATLRGWTLVDAQPSMFYIDGGAIVVAEFASFPAWLRSEREYENFELEGEFFIRGWTDSGLYLHAPEHGRPTQAGFQIKVFHQREEKPTPYSMGALFPVVAPSKPNVHDGWNSIRIRFDWPRLEVATNGEKVLDVDVESMPELRHRLRRGYIGIAAASTPCRFRNLRIRELPSKERWIALYEQPGDLEKNWMASEGKPEFQEFGGVLRSAGLGHLATRQKFRDFELQTYVRTSAQHNGGIILRSSGRGQANPRGYEIQLHNVEEAHFPTGSLYHLKRARYPRIENEKWFLMQLIARGKTLVVRVDGETILEYDALDILDEGFIELQAHRRGYWAEFKHIRVKPL